MDTVEDKVIRIIADQALLDPSEVTPASTLAELGIDSMALVETIFAIEETFDVSVPFNANEPAAGQFDISSVGSIVAAVEDLVAARV
ncbi:acyl carrier protein [Falsirhodobacter sp. 1013]|uniref:acyl carrier protein n=1 Tax=Falsirhodobacter sp. 1013 TaxID=3417566 RepID=UPI003EBADE60